MQYIFNAHEKYWWWLDKVGPSSFIPTPTINNFENNQAIGREMIESYAFGTNVKEIKTRKRRNSVLDIENWISDIYRLIRTGCLTYIYGRTKQRLFQYDTPKGRSSNYVGVSKNGENWQVLINCGKFKKYIGTFSSEKQAAITYDFYSICLHLSKAKTNFSYDSQLILEMVECYNRKAKTFDASRFVDRV